ncbi:hypothetical protein SPI_00819 [Niveomyces insectorum RCEF 264]|uniref:Mid2-like cell wall stress sensor n=1 Tax=Niveomyces insectorum RCEF 264 TaxID=1081102 RepID=A0A162LCF8_9HYPO|nr:hypothetical protein SPI_00819 [Niveomyces insectorum RCEF 264]
MPTIPPQAAVAWLLIAAATWIPRGASAYSVPLNDLTFWGRAASTSTCAAGFSQCKGANFPSNFCCSASTTCNVLAGNTTILCCPSGENCSLINPITCDLSQQNADTNPDAAIKTTALNGVLTRCGSGTCCPFGYSCDTSNLCTLNVDQNAAPLQTVAPPPAATSAKPPPTTSKSVPHTTTQPTNAGVTVAEASTKTSVASSPTGATAGTTGADANESAVANADDKSGGGSASKASIVGGVIGGLAGLLLVGAAVWFFCGRRLRRHSVSSSGSGGLRQNPNDLAEINKLSRSTSSFGNIINNPLSISSPKPQNETTAFRTDFIRKMPMSPDQTSRPTTPAGRSTAPGGPLGISSSGYTTNASPLSASTAPGVAVTVTPPQPAPLAQRQQQQQSKPVPIAPIRGMRGAPLSRQQREPSTEEINVGVDPSIIGLAGSFGLSPPEAVAPLRLHTTSTGTRRNDRMTTFSSLMMAADLDPERPYVQGSAQSSPASRQR